MKTAIYYFTGTGNSLAAAKKIATILGDCELVPIASLTDSPGDIIPAAERVGIICPVYFSGLPAMVASFAARLDPTPVRYIFAVVTLGGSGGSAALRQIDGILKSRGGRGLDRGFAVKMPGNYILMYESPAGKKREKILADAEVQLEGVAREIQEGRVQKLPYSFFAQVIHSLMYPGFISHVHDNDRKFSVSDACTSCGICAAICPSGNIGLVAGKPVWKHRCELCCGCIHFCPVQAIQAGRNTEKRQRYHNPSVNPAELKGQREKKP